MKNSLHSQRKANHIFSPPGFKPDQDFALQYRFIERLIIPWGVFFFLSFSPSFFVSSLDSSYFITIFFIFLSRLSPSSSYRADFLPRPFVSNSADSAFTTHESKWTDYPSRSWTKSFTNFAAIVQHSLQPSNVSPGTPGARVSLFFNVAMTVIQPPYGPCLSRQGHSARLRNRFCIMSSI